MLTGNTVEQQIDFNEASAELHTILDVIRWSVSRFNESGLYFGHGTDNAWDEALSLVLQVLHLPFQGHEQLYPAKLTTSEKELIFAYVEQRIEKKIPVAYLTNVAWFCNLPFFVDERVLVPRSPFAELIQKEFSPYINSQPESILDLCTGSACIAIALAYQFPNSVVDAVDISDDALAVADINIQEHGLTERVLPIKSDLMSALEGHKYDLIVSNPPYVDAEDMADLPQEFHYEPEIGLAAGNDGLDLVDVILKEAPDHLNDGGWLFVEVGNSLVHVADKYPGLDLNWVEFELGGDGVFAIQKEALQQYFEQES